MMDDPSKNKQIDFKLRCGKGNRSELVFGAENETLAEVIMKRFPKTKIEQSLFWANVKSDHSHCNINPFTFLCGWLERGSCVDWQSVNENVCKKPDFANEQASFFLIDNWNRENKEAITQQHHTKLRSQYLCVAANAEQTLYEALRDDGRFKKVNRFELKCQHSTVVIALYEKAISCKGYIFNVVLKKGPQPLERDLGSPETKLRNLEDKSCTDTKPVVCSLPTSSQQFKVEPSSKDDASVENQGNGEFFKKTSPGVFVSSKEVDQLSNNEMFAKMRKCARANARATLVKPAEQTENWEKEVKTLCVTQLAKKDAAARPARFTRELGRGPFIDSVGKITCGSITATCFLVSSKMVITNFHVLQMIRNARSSSDAVTYSEMLVDFNYETPGAFIGSGCVKVQQPLFTHVEHVYSFDFDYAFLCLEEEVQGKIPLGHWVKCRVPTNGLLCILGHPQGREKLDDTCVILPLQNRSEEIARRVAEKEERCLNNPMECVLDVGRNIEGVKCIHMHSISTANEKSLSYDVSEMFQGSSGSPVIDMGANIVALHALGYDLEENKKQTSLIEFGITFKAIIDDLKRRGYGDMVKKIFPNCEVEAMDQT